MYTLQCVKEDEGGYSVLEPEGIQSTKSPKDSLHKRSLQHTNQLFIKSSSTLDGNCVVSEGERKKERKRKKERNSTPLN